MVERNGRKVRQHLFQRGRILRILEEPSDGRKIDVGTADRRKACRRRLNNLRDRAQAVFDSQESPHNPAEFIIDSMSKKTIAGNLCVIIDRMLEKDDGTIALACNLAILMNDFNNVLGPNDIFVEGARMVEGRRQGPAVRSEKSTSARAEARRAANDLFKDAPVYRLTPKKAAREMLRRGESGEPGGITGVNESTLRGYIRDLCGTGQSRT